MNSPDIPYTGRFAPTPSGPLHFGSLVAALASYLDARAVGGQWLVRMEDIDPPREQPGAADTILKALDAYGLHWDGPVMYQSNRSEAYRAALDELKQRELLYPCTCSRKKLSPYQGRYPGFCRNLTESPQAPYSLRLKTPARTVTFDDRIQGTQAFPLDEIGDSILLRKDGLFAYQLAVVIDDAEQGITDIVRGSDLLDSTPRQQYLRQLFDFPEPVYAHLPVILNDNGSKLSKQNHADALPLDNPLPLLARALQALSQPVPESVFDLTVEALLQWSVDHWNIESIPSRMGIPLK
ncbi:tRNA glutamyl-Q(34) synthetase GluQRS [Endozoicomonadaceae bacterium StTr2]